MSKIITLLAFVILALGVSACSKTPDNYYDRAINSSNESLKSLDNE